MGEGKGEGGRAASFCDGGGVEGEEGEADTFGFWEGGGGGGRRWGGERVDLRFLCDCV